MADTFLLWTDESPAQRAERLLLAGVLTDTQQARCVELGLLTAAQVSAAAQTLATDRATTRAAVRQIVTDLRAEKTRAQAIIDTANATINAGAAAYVKDAARAAKRVADAAIDLAKLVKDL